ncbi:MAG: hypothetical protein FJX68_17040, partial [Alphaproteobacteria bacterium]|nr:hypothetical protein [Alphaproteobacteria bacterium]
LDFVHDQFALGRRFRILNIVDDVTRECLAAIPDFAWPAIGDVMSINGTGIITKRDFLSIHFERQEVWTTFSEFAVMSEREARQHFNLPDDVRDWRFDWAKKDLCDSGPSQKCIKPILYRPFDIRQIYYTGQARGFIGWPVFQVMGHMIAGENLAIITARSNKFPEPDHFFASKTIVETKCGESSTQSATFPLYLYPGVGKSDGSMFETWPAGKGGRRPNLDPGFVQAIAQATGLTFVSDGRGDLKKQFGPEDALAYIYAVFHSPEYRRRFEPMLKLDFPRVPTLGSAEPFAALALPGHDLLALHLLDSPKLAKPITEFISSRGSEVAKVSWSKNTVWIDKAQTTTGFKGVREDVWNFHIGGYQVCEKWLKDRKGRTLSKDDIAHYQKIVVALSETIRLMKEIDEVIEKHGGWPGAFQTGSSQAVADAEEPMLDSGS